MPSGANCLRVSDGKNHQFVGVEIPARDALNVGGGNALQISHVRLPIRGITPRVFVGDIGAQHLYFGPKPLRKALDEVGNRSVHVLLCDRFAMEPADLFKHDLGRIGTGVTLALEPALEITILINALLKSAPCVVREPFVGPRRRKYHGMGRGNFG